MSQKTIEASKVALQVLEAIRATNPELIADNMPPSWGMNKLREALNVRHLCVDGHVAADRESDWAGDGQFPPFAVFDIDMQQNLLPHYETRALAEIAMNQLLAVERVDAHDTVLGSSSEDAGIPRKLMKSRFDTEQEANFYKREHQLTQRVAEPIAGGKWGLVFPIKAHIAVRDGAPEGLREHQGKMVKPLTHEANANVQPAIVGYARVKSYRVKFTGHDGVQYDEIQPFTDAHAKSMGTVIETDGIAIWAATKLVARWIQESEVQGTKREFSIPFVSKEKVLEVAQAPGPSKTSLESEQQKFEYQLLGRLKQDCEYYLGEGARNKKRLWALDEELQIKKMKELYESLPIKPEWLSLDAIDAYEKQMSANENADYWYLNRNHLESGQVFRMVDDTLVKLDCRVAGDGTKWRVADWSNGWSYSGNEIEPGDLRGAPLEEPHPQDEPVTETPKG